jgi:hypothetical protein
MPAQARLLTAYSEPLLAFLEALRATLVWAVKAAARQAYVSSGLEHTLATFGQDLRFFMAMGAGAILDDHRLALVACAIFTSVIIAILGIVGLTVFVLGWQIYRTGSPSSPRHPFVLTGGFLGVALSLGGLEGALVAAVAWACLGLAAAAERARLPWAQWARSGEAQHWAMRPNGRPAALYPHSWHVYTVAARVLAGLGRLFREQGGALWRLARPLLGAPRALGLFLGHTFPTLTKLGPLVPAAPHSRRRLRHVHLASELEIFWTGKGSIFALTFLLLSFSARALLVIVGAGLL